MINDDKEKKGRLVLDAIANIDPDLICEAAPGEGTSTRKQAKESPSGTVRMLPVYARIGAVAAALLLVAGLIAAGFFTIDSGSEDPGQPSGLKIGSGRPQINYISSSETKPVPNTEAPSKPSSETKSDPATESKNDPASETKSDSDTTKPSNSYVITFNPNGGSVMSTEGNFSGWSYYRFTEKTQDSRAYRLGSYSIISSSKAAVLEFHNASKGDGVLDLRATFQNDNENPERLLELTSSQKVTFPAYGLDPTVKTAVALKDTNAGGLTGLKVEAVYSDDKTLIWSSYANASGVANLYFSAYDGRPWNLRIYDPEGNVVYDQTGLTKHPETMDVCVDTTSASYDKTQVMFIFDTTGSMADTLTYFQAWFEDITLCTDAANPEYSLNFYRDQGEAYVTKTNRFETDLNVLKETLNNASAYGGGDEPEAVAEILTKTMNSDAWKADSRKIAFLIFDAPPHAEKADEIFEAVAQASAKGIRLIPVVASYAPTPEVESFSRALAIMTNGEYVFLADDPEAAGTGRDTDREDISHIFYTGPLYSIITRIINRYGA